MASVNKVILIGRLGKDPEVRYTPSGTPVANFSVATDDTWKDKRGEKQQRTEWHNIVVWNKLAEICGQYLQKGKQVYLEGKLQTRKWEDKNGVTRYTTEIIVDQMVMLGSKGSGNGDSKQPEPRHQEPEPVVPEPFVAEDHSPDIGITDDDIPF